MKRRIHHAEGRGAPRLRAVGVRTQEMVPDCAPEEVMEEGDFRKWDISRAIEWDITVNQPDGYVVGLVG